MESLLFVIGSLLIIGIMSMVVYALLHYLHNILKRGMDEEHGYIKTDDRRN